MFRFVRATRQFSWVRVRNACFAALIAGVFMSCAETPEIPETIIRPVRYITVHAQVADEEKTLSGTAQAATEAKLSFRVTGTIEKLPVAVGDRVKSGDLIAEIDDTDFGLRVQQARANLAQAQAQATNAKASYERVQLLYANRNASKSDFDSALAQRDASNAQVRSAQQHLALAQSQIGYTKLRAPQSGVISEVNVEVNENLQAGKAVATLSSIGQTEVRVPVPESLIARIREGNMCHIRFAAVDREEPFRGVVSEVGFTSSEKSTTYPVTVVLTECGPDVLPGMAAEVTFYLAAGDDGPRIVVPVSAVSEDSAGTRYVFTLDDAEPGFANTVKRTVRIGSLSGEGIEIIEGLVPEERVVTAGVSRIRDGQRVKVRGQSSTPISP